jgi:hypothetical protein
MTTAEQLRRQIEQGRQALQQADQALRDIEATLERSDRVSAEELPKLRRAGLIP